MGLERLALAARRQARRQGLSRRRWRPVLGQLDDPSDGSVISGDTVHVRGWAVDRLGHHRGVVVLVDGIAVTRIPCGDDRPDVALALPAHPGAATSGFSADVRIDEALGAAVEIAVGLRRSSGDVVVFGRKRLQTGGRHDVVAGGIASPHRHSRLDRSRLELRGWYRDAAGAPDEIEVTLDGQQVGRGTTFDGPSVDEPVRDRSVGDWLAEADLTRAAPGPGTLEVRARRGVDPPYSLGSVPVTVRATRARALVRGTVDQPFHGTSVARGSLRVAGWALSSGSPVTRVDLTVDGQVVAAARLGVARADVAAGSGLAEAPICGFEDLIDLGPLTRGRPAVVLGATAHMADGTRHDLDSARVRFEASPRVKGSAERAAVLSARTQALGASYQPARDRLRILAVTHHLGMGGGQLYLYELVRLLLQRPDVEVFVVAPAEGPLRDSFEKLGAVVHVVSGYPVTDGAAYEARVQEIATWGMAHGANVAIVNTVAAFPGAQAALALGLPTVWAVHESFGFPLYWSAAYPPGHLDEYVRERAESAVTEAAAVVFEADATRDQYAVHGDARRYLTVPYGIDTAAISAYAADLDRAEARLRLGIPQDATVLLCLGTIEPRKAQTLLAQAFGRVCQDYPDAHLVLVGDMPGPFSDSLHEHIRRIGLKDRCTIVPVVPDVYDYYATADVLVCASDIESLPRTVLEAMAFEVLILATAVFGLPELLEDGRTGLLCEPRDLLALESALRRVLTMTPEQRRAIAQAGAERVRHGNDSKGYADTYLSLCRGLLESPGAYPADLLAGPTLSS